MTKSLNMMAAGFFILLVAGTAQADCASDLAKLEGTSAMPSDNSASHGAMAPSGAASTGVSTEGAAAATSAGANKIAKDGTTAPLQEPGTNVTDRAMSGQDAQAQQGGAVTAADQARSESGDDSRSIALKEARAAMEAGDEAGCRSALERASAS